MAAGTTAGHSSVSVSLGSIELTNRWSTSGSVVALVTVSSLVPSKSFEIVCRSTSKGCELEVWALS